MKKLSRYWHQVAPHENRDAIAAAVFVPAAIVVAINLELSRFHLGFWIASGLAAVSWLCSYHRLLPLAALLGFVALRLGVASVTKEKPIYLVVALVSAVVGIVLLKLQRQ